MTRRPGVRRAAAHAAGTARAARDGRALAEALEERHGLDGALDEWASAQREYGRELVEQGRRVGLERLG